MAEFKIYFVDKWGFNDREDAEKQKGDRQEGDIDIDREEEESNSENQ